MATEGRYEGDDPTRVVARPTRGGPGPEMGPGPMYGGYGPWGYGGPWQSRSPIETKPFFLTSEFAAFAIAELALIITAAADNSVDARLFWYLTTALVGLYMLSRGIAKSGTRSMAPDPREHMDLFGSRGQGGGGGGGSDSR